MYVNFIMGLRIDSQKYKLLFFLAESRYIDNIF